MSLTSGHIFILQELANRGPTKASFFWETDVDELFKVKPRLICLVRGFDDAVIDITGEGRKALVASRPTG